MERFIQSIKTSQGKDMKLCYQSQKKHMESSGILLKML